MRFTRRHFLGGAAAAAVAGGGIYELVDKLGSSPTRPVAEPAGIPPEQHLFDLSTVQSEGVDVLVPPMHSEVVTATLHAPDLAKAQAQLEDVLRDLDARYPLSPAGLGVTVAWGLPYFHRYVAEQAKAHLPFDRRAQKPVLLPNRTFPSDPSSTILESNDVVVLLRSDHVEHIDDARKTIFALPFFAVTSIRHGFAGGGFEGGPGLPKKMGVAAGVPGADLIPDGAELFLGFTSTQKAGLGPGKIANHETLGYVDLRSGYFHGGTHMHLSHINEDLEAWYLNFDFDERVLTSFRTGLSNVKQGTQTVPQRPQDVSTRAG
ncbi:MAG: twin-arginine translocation signal domain-containing protein, partial [Actinobacteria bacterium]|nr:twin-arginine translocation signal domain-containing protein [Actinomycetota bacterium]